MVAASPRGDWPKDEQPQGNHGRLGGGDWHRGTEMHLADRGHDEAKPQTRCYPDRSVLLEAGDPGSRSRPRLPDAPARRHLINRRENSQLHVGVLRAAPKRCDAVLRWALGRPPPLLLLGGGLLGGGLLGGRGLRRALLRFALLHRHWSFLVQRHTCLIPTGMNRPVPAPIHTKSFNIWKRNFARNGLFFVDRWNSIRLQA